MGFVLTMREESRKSVTRHLDQEIEGSSPSSPANTTTCWVCRTEKHNIWWFERVRAFRSRPLDPAGYPYVSLDALYHKVREGGRVVSMVTLIAIGISATGQRSVLGVEVATAGGDEGVHWLPFLRSLTARGLVGVRLVISDAQPGLVAAVEATSWAPPGNAVGCTPPGMPWGSWPGPPRAWSPGRPGPTSSACEPTPRPPTGWGSRSTSTG